MTYCILYLKVVYYVIVFLFLDDTKMSLHINEARKSFMFTYCVSDCNFIIGTWYFQHKTYIFTIDLIVKATMWKSLWLHRCLNCFARSLTNRNICMCVLLLAQSRVSPSCIRGGHANSTHIGFKSITRVLVESLTVSSPPLYSRRRGDHRRERWATDWSSGRNHHGDGDHRSSRPCVCLHVQPPHLQRQPLLHGGQWHHNP